MQGFCRSAFDAFIQESLEFLKPADYNESEQKWFADFEADQYIYVLERGRLYIVLQAHFPVLLKMAAIRLDCPSYSWECEPIITAEREAEIRSLIQSKAPDECKVLSG